MLIAYVVKGLRFKDSNLRGWHNDAFTLWLYASPSSG